MPIFHRKKSGKEDANPYAQQNSAPMSSLQRTQAELGLQSNSRPGLPSGPKGGGPTPPQQQRGQPAPYGGQPGNGPSNGPRPYGAPPQGGAAGTPGGYGGGGGGGGGSGYSAGGYGAQGGYGSNRYDAGAPSDGRPPSYRSTADSVPPASGGGYGGAGARQSGARRGGYGGMGGVDEADDSSRQALFGNAPQKFAAQAEAGRPTNASGPSGSGPSAGGGGGEADGGYGGGSYGQERELTEEEQEDAEVKRIGEETRYLRNETDQSLDRSLLIANQSIETARATMARMHNQRERLINVDKNLDAASNHNKIAEHRAAELKHYNRSMFAVKVNNPFTSKQRAAAKAQADLDEHREQRAQREETRRLAYRSNVEAEQQFDKLDKSIAQGRQLGAKAGGSNKFALEDDDENDDAMERGIDNKIGLLENAVGTLNFTAKAMGEFLDEDLQHIDRIAQKSDNVDDQVRANRYKLERIEKRG